MARTKGAKGKIGVEVKEQIVACYHRLGALEAFCDWAKENRTDFYKMFVSLAPKELSVDATVRSEVELTDEELGRIAAGCSAGVVASEESAAQPSELH